MNIISIIPARGGSKSIPKKNLVDFIGEPLILKTITQAQNSLNINRTIVSTDDKEIKNIALERKAEVIDRPKEISGDYSSDIQFIEHAVNWFNQEEGNIFMGRKNLIQRCLSNLIDNSLKFAKNIKIKQYKIKKNLLIFIDDDGPGIPTSEYDNVFKPFYKIDKSRGHSKSSVGLGLSISSDIIRSHGGNIELMKSEMGGLKIKISLPV